MKVKDLKKWLEQFPEDYIMYTDIDGVIGVYDPNDQDNYYVFGTHHGIHTNIGDSKDYRGIT